MNYPTQDEAEALLNWFNATEELTFAGAPLTREAFNKAEDLRMEVWHKVFGNNSPWIIRSVKGHKLVVEWDSNKAKKLNL